YNLASGPERRARGNYGFPKAGHSRMRVASAFPFTGQEGPHLVRRDSPTCRSGTWIRWPFAFADKATWVTTRCCCSGESLGNIGSESTWEAACSATGKSPGRKPRVL